MLSLPYVQPVDYLVIGHLTQDLTPDGPRMGGTAAFAALTARALGLRVGIVTATTPDVTFDHLEGIQVVSKPSEYNTTFTNINTPTGRIQYLSHTAEMLIPASIPDPWRSTPIVHLGPVAQEVEPSLVWSFPDSLIGVTPQGWMRAWNDEGLVRPTEWLEASFVLGKAGAAVCSIEDVQGDEERIEAMANSVRVLAVTEGAGGARLFWNGDVRRFKAPQVPEVEPTGAGDIFAACFFWRLHITHDPWEATRFAVQLASLSVTRAGLNSIPTRAEIEATSIEIIN